MQLWETWLDALRSLLEVLSSSAGLGTGLAIIALTILLRMALLPVSGRLAYRACVRQQRLKRLQPQLKRLRERYPDQPQKLTEAMLELYRRNGLSFVETGPILGSLLQMPVFVGMFSVLQQGWQQARFLWVTSLARPDFFLALIAAGTTVLMMLANPDLPEQTRLLLIILPSALAFFFALKFASALALYWAASNCFTAVQTAAIHNLVDRRIRSGAIRL